MKELKRQYREATKSYDIDKAKEIAEKIKELGA